MTPLPIDQHTEVVLEEEDRREHLSHAMDDLLGFLRTCITEAGTKVPVQLRTGLQCVLHFAIFLNSSFPAICKMLVARA